MGLIYEMKIRPKIGRTVISTQNVEFINMDVSGERFCDTLNAFYLFSLDLYFFKFN